MSSGLAESAAALTGLVVEWGLEHGPPGTQAPGDLMQERRAVGWGRFQWILEW